MPARDRGLAGAGLADQGEHLAGGDGQADVVDGADAAPVDDGEVADVEDRGRGRRGGPGGAAAQGGDGVQQRSRVRPRHQPLSSVEGRP
ncbi:hypothetical protein Lfu02_08720 [Longispora fulva]|uniref:hypothetical protein n=1 Tax=Longispora fulva TaxID=619741 RepID=UPI001A6159BC|nr:hypothetical protein Lfu02_08720 [Longispora fulva]